MAGGEERQWALTQKRTLWGGGALQLLDLRLLEDGGEREGAPAASCRARSGSASSDVVEMQTVSGDCEISGVSMGADTKANTWGRRLSLIHI